MPARYVSKADRDRIEQEARVAGKFSTPLVGDDRPGVTIMYVFLEDRSNPPELHENADDVYIIVEGSGVVQIDGELRGAEEKTPGEWVGGQVVGGSTVDVSAGDMVDIPRGVPHSMSCPGGAVKLMVVKTAGPVT